MTQDEIIEMARQSGAMFEHMTCVERDLFPVLYRFAELVAEKEREACAETCEGVWLDTVEAQNHNDKCVKAIRARRKA